MSTELKHYGIKGMRWGIRRTPEQLGHVRSSRGTEKKTADPSKMSDEELRRQTNRLELEERYAAAKDKQKARSTSAVSKLLSNAANQLASQALSKVVNKIIDKIFDKKEGNKKKKKDKKYTGKDYDKMNLSKMDDEMIAKAVQWYQNAYSLNTLRLAQPEKSKKGNKNNKPPKRGN